VINIPSSALWFFESSINTVLPHIFNMVGMERKMIALMTGFIIGGMISLPISDHFDHRDFSEMYIFQPHIEVKDNDVRLNRTVEMNVISSYPNADIDWVVGGSYEYSGPRIAHTFDRIGNIPVNVTVTYRGSTGSAHTLITVKPMDQVRTVTFIKPFDRTAFRAHTIEIMERGQFIEVQGSPTLPTLEVWINMTMASGMYTFGSVVVDDTECMDLSVEERSCIGGPIIYHAEIEPGDYEGSIRDPTLMGGSVTCEHGTCPCIEIRIEVHY